MGGLPTELTCGHTIAVTKNGVEVLTLRRDETPMRSSEMELNRVSGILKFSEFAKGEKVLCGCFASSSGRIDKMYGRLFSPILAVCEWSIKLNGKLCIHNIILAVFLFRERLVSHFVVRPAQSCQSSVWHNRSHLAVSVGLPFA